MKIYEAGEEPTNLFFSWIAMKNWTEQAKIKNFFLERSIFSLGRWTKRCDKRSGDKNDKGKSSQWLDKEQRLILAPEHWSFSWERLLLKQRETVLHPHAQPRSKRLLPPQLIGETCNFTQLPFCLEPWAGMTFLKSHRLLCTGEQILHKT